MHQLAHSTAAPWFVGAAAVCSCLAISAADPATPGGVIPVCPTKALLGIDCPGCGSMRMIQSLTHLRLNDALHYNAVGLFFVGILCWSWIAWVARTRGKQIPDFLNWHWAPVAVGVIAGLWFIARVIPIEPFVQLQV